MDEFSAHFLPTLRVHWRQLLSSIMTGQGRIQRGWGQRGQFPPLAKKNKKGERKKERKKNSQFE